MALLQVGG